MLDPQKENILLLGMVFSDQLLPTRGQEFRDRVRCIQLQRLGFNVCTSIKTIIYPPDFTVTETSIKQGDSLAKFVGSGEMMLSSVILFWTTSFFQ